jgi:hypothetical protein
VASAIALRRIAKKADEYFKKVSNENEIWQKQLDDLVEVKYEHQEMVVIKAEPDYMLEDDGSSLAADPDDDFHEENSFAIKTPRKKKRPKYQPKSYDCPHCDERLTCSLKLRNHIFQIHQDFGFTCDVRFNFLSTF